MFYTLQIVQVSDCDVIKTDWHPEINYSFFKLQIRSMELRQIGVTVLIRINQDKTKLIATKPT